MILSTSLDAGLLALCLLPFPKNKGRVSQNVVGATTSESPGAFGHNIKHGPHLRLTTSASLEWGPGICTAHRLPS